MIRSHTALWVLVAAAALTLAGCGGGGGTPSEVVLVTHDAFAISPEVKQAFEDESGLKLRILKAGDAGEVVTRALLTAGNPEGDVLFGIDNNLLAAGSRRRRVRGIRVSRAPERRSRASTLDHEHRVTPDRPRRRLSQFDKTLVRRAWLAAPTRLDELTLPRYRNLS